MEGLGAEITQKIKHAIQAKLNELGSYVDDELPDYVMVMVGNKRSKAQMEHDLKLFLGSNTVPFTTWLYQVLEKLQEITVKNNAKAKKKERTPSLEEDQDFINIKAEPDGDLIEEEVPSKKKPVPEKPVKVKANEKSIEYLPSKIKDRDKRISEERISEKKLEKVNKDTDISAISKKRSLRDDPIGSSNKKSTSTSTESNRVSSRDDSYKKSEDSTKRRSSPNSPVKDHGSSDKMIYDAREVLNRKKAEKLASSKEGLSSKNDQNSKRKREWSPDDVRYSKRAISSHNNDCDNVSHRLSASRDCERERNSRDKEGLMKSTIHRTSLKRKGSDDEKTVDERSDRDRRKDSDKRTDSGRSSKVSRITETAKESESSKSRGSSKSMISGSERKSVHSRVMPPLKDSGRDSDRERDRDHEKDSGVSSVIRITPRPKRPASQQPSSSLILKAVAEANKSLAAVPLRQQSTTNRNSGRSLRGKISPDKITITLPNHRVQPVVTKDETVSSNAHVTLESSKMRLKDDVDKMLLNSKEEFCENAGKNDTQISMKASSSSNSQRTDVSENDKEMDDAINQWLNGVENTASVKPLPDSYSSHETDVDSEPVLEICQNISELEPEPEEEPEFVVTLHGLDPDMFPKVNDDEEEDFSKEVKVKLDDGTVEMDDDVTVDKHGNNDVGDGNNDLHVNNELLVDKRKSTLSPELSSTDTSPDKKRKASSPIVIVKQSANVSQVVAVVDTLDAVKVKSFERCKFWPNCLLGDKCSYNHPTAMCNAFPTCKYGDSCMFIHPTCKFGVACTRRDCLYLHGTPVTGAPKSKANTLVAAQPCRFYPNCNNANCQFYHPKPCRFGRYCSKKDCQFDHKKGPSKDKLKWIRAQKT